jgi:glyceraldehyde-3-phosphate dehydrogenase (NAD(P))
MKVLVNGLGNIGTTLANVLLEFRAELGIDTVYVFKNWPEPWLEQDEELLKAHGAVFCESVDEALRDSDFLFECRSHASDLDDLIDRSPKILGAVAQGGEGDFGPPFMSGVNAAAIYGEKRVHVVSCNTHGLGSILQLFGGPDLSNLVGGDAVVVRRSDDLSNHEKLVSANVVVRHSDPLYGTHHGADLHHLFATVGINCSVTTSDITTPSQLMHGLRFSLTLNNENIIDRVQAGGAVALTEKFDSNRIFELGRRYGFQGRIFSQSILVAPSLLIHGNTVRGWAFVPQEGNTILSTIEAFLLQTKSPLAGSAIKNVRDLLLQPAW